MKNSIAVILVEIESHYEFHMKQSILFNCIFIEAKVYLKLILNNNKKYLNF